MNGTNSNESTARRRPCSATTPLAWPSSRAVIWTSTRSWGSVRHRGEVPGRAGGRATLAGDDAEADGHLGEAFVDERDDAVAPGGAAGGLGHGGTIARCADGVLTPRCAGGQPQFSL